MGQVGDEPWDYWIGREMLLVVRAERSPAALGPALRRVVQRIDARVPLYDVRTTGERVAAALAVERFSTRLLVALGLAALALAAIGIHGVVAYAASARAREVGIRLALGATAEAIVALVVGQGMRPVWIGLAAGLAVVAVAGRALEGLLFGVRPFDPASLGVAAALLALAGIAACLGPARRLARVDPAITLRGD
jgi:putative ABC transport system permease protein